MAIASPSSQDSLLHGFSAGNAVPLRGSTLGARMQDARCLRGLDVCEVASSLGVSPKIYRSWEFDRSVVPAAALTLLADLLRVPLPALLQGSKATRDEADTAAEEDAERDPFLTQSDRP